MCIRDRLLCPGGAACFPDGRGNFYGWHGPGAGFDAGADPQRGLSFRDAFSPVSYTHLDVYKRQVVKYLKYFTFLSMEEIEDLEKEVAEHPEHRNAQRCV